MSESEGVGTRLLLLLLLLVPVAPILEVAGAPGALVFVAAVAGTVPLAGFLGRATEEVVIDRVHPDPEAGGPEPMAPGPDGPWRPIAAQQSGYVQRVDLDALFELARRSRVVVRMERGIGEFALEGTPLVSLAGAAADPELVRGLLAAYTLGPHRMHQQDVGQGIQEIVDVALKSLSTGINEPNTAVNCVDQLGVVLCRLATRRIDLTPREEGGRVRLIPRGPTFETHLDDAFAQVRAHTSGRAVVLARMLSVLEAVAAATRDPDRRRAVERHAEEVLAAVERDVPSQLDRASILGARSQS